MRKKFVLSLLTAILVVVGGLSAVTSASADSVGQCNNRPGNYVGNTSKWQSVLRHEGVLSQAERRIFRSAGYVSVDQSFGQWTKARVMTAAVTSPFGGSDYSCRNGKLLGAGQRHYSSGKKVFAVLPSKYSKSSMRLKRSKTFSKKVRIKVRVIGLADCGNPFSGYAWINIFVHVTVKKTTKPAPAPQPPAIVCASGYELNSLNQCVQQTNESSESCGNNQVWSSTGCITVQVNNNCGTVVINGVDVTVSGDNCSTTTTTPTSPTPTITVNNVTSLQEVYNDGETYPNLYADVYSPEGDTITCVMAVFDAANQSISNLGSIYGTRSYTFTSAGYNREGPWTYQAPDDGTGAVVGQYAEVGVTCIDNTDSSVEKSVSYSSEFEIQATLSNPS